MSDAATSLAGANLYEFTTDTVLLYVSLIFSFKSIVC